MPRREESLNDSLMARERTNVRKFFAPQNTSASFTGSSKPKAGSCLGHGPAPACVVLKNKKAAPTRGLLASRIEFPGFPGRHASGDAQIVGRRLAGTAVRHDLVGDLLAFTQRAKPGTFDSADVHEHVVAAVVRLNKAEALGCVEPLHSSHAHGDSPLVKK